MCAPNDIAGILILEWKNDTQGGLFRLLKDCALDVATMERFLNAVVSPHHSAS